MKKYRLIFFFVASILIAVCIGIDAQPLRQIDTARLKKIVYPPLTVREGKDLALPLPPVEHPRLFFRQSHLSDIKWKANHPLLRECWEKVNESANFITDGRLAQNLAQGAIHNVDMQIVNAIEARAFMYALTNDRKMGNEAVDLVFNLNNTFIYPLEVEGVEHQVGQIMLTTAVVYDWCYDLITPEEKKSLIAIMESLAADMEVKWPNLVQGSVTGHGTEAQLAKEILSFGIAVYDEKPEIYRRAAGRLFAELIPAQKFWYPSGYHHQGSSYGPYRYQWEIFPPILFDRMGYPNVTSDFQGKIPYYWIYSRRPDGLLFRDGDDSQDVYTFGYYPTFTNLAYAASYYQDPLLMGEAIRQGTIGRRTPLYDLLLIDPSVSASHDIAALPLTKYFPYPFGGMVVRTGWDPGFTSNAVVAEMKIAERQFNNHQHLDAGGFQIYYKGPLAIESGIYGGTEGRYGSSHFQNYYQRTIAHNCMLVYNPDEIFTWHRRPVANDGGQRWPTGAAEPRTIDIVLSEEHKKGEVKAYHFGPDPVRPEYSYLKGDITQAYTDKVKNHQRAFVFLNLCNTQVPAAMIVYDYITSSNKNFKKTWLLHCVQEPVFSENVCTVVCNEKGYDGKLVNTVLLPLPQNIHLAKTGGTGNEYSVNGINYPQRLQRENNAGDGVAWRIELSPKTPSETDVFLNVMQVTDAGNTQLLPVEKIETDLMTGVIIGDRIVLFAKSGNPENSPVALNIKGTGTFKVLITDLEKGNWEITGPKAPGIVRNDHDLVYFQATAGNYMITKK